MDEAAETCINLAKLCEVVQWLFLVTYQWYGSTICFELPSEAEPIFQVPSVVPCVQFCSLQSFAPLFSNNTGTLGIRLPNAVFRACRILTPNPGSRSCRVPWGDLASRLDTILFHTVSILWLSFNRSDGVSQLVPRLNSRLLIIRLCGHVCSRKPQNLPWQPQKKPPQPWPWPWPSTGWIETLHFCSGVVLGVLLLRRSWFNVHFHWAMSRMFTQTL